MLLNKHKNTSFSCIFFIIIFSPLVGKIAAVRFENSLLTGKGGVTLKKTLIWLSVTLLLVFGAVQAVSAAGMGWGGGQQMMNCNMKCNPLEKLNLTEQQMSKMKELSQKSYEQTRDLRIKMMDSKYELRQLKLQGNPDQAQINAKTKEISDLQSQLRGIMQQNMDQCQSLLTKEQQEQVKQLRGHCRGFAGGSGAVNQ